MPCRDSALDAAAELERLGPGGENEPPADLHRLIAVSRRRHVLGALEQPPPPAEAELPHQDWHQAAKRGRAARDLFSDAIPPERQQEAPPWEPDAKCPLGHAFIGSHPDSRVEGKAAAVAAAEIEGVRPLLVGARLLPPLVVGGYLPLGQH